MGPRLAQGLLESLDDEAGGVGLHVHFGLAVPGTWRTSSDLRRLRPGSTSPNQFFFEDS